MALKCTRQAGLVAFMTDGRIVTLPRFVEPKEDVALLLGVPGFTLPAQPPPKISGNVASQETDVW